MQPATELAGFIDASPTPFHAVDNAAARLVDAGFEWFDPVRATRPGARFIVRDGALLAWVDSDEPFAPCRIIGAHTDSPNLRVRPRPDTGRAGFRQLGVEVYGGPLLNSWLDRDLGLAGRVAARSADGHFEHRLFRSGEALLRVPQLAIHLDREISERGLVLNRQQHMTPVWGLGDPNEGLFVEWLSEQVGCRPGDVLAWDAACFDTQPSSLLGLDQELLAAPRLDNLCSSFGALEALIAARWSGGPGPSFVVLYDYEEVGSVAATGADSTWATATIEQRTAALGGEPGTSAAMLQQGALLSADMAHGTHPNYPERHEPNHWVRLGGGPVIKHNVNVRYATDSAGAALFRLACDDADVAVQDYSHRGDLPCGSTIGPISAAQFAMTTVDVGMAQLSMHSVRELMAADDVASMVAAFSSWFTVARS